LFRKLFKIVFRFFIFYLFLFLTITAVAYYALQLPKFQTVVVSKLTDLLAKKLKSKVKIGSVDISWTNAINLKKVVVEDENGRKMLDIDEIDLAYSLLDLDYPKFKLINLDYIMLKKPNIKIVVEKDGSLNIQNFIDSINELTASDKPSKPNQNLPFTIDEAYIEDGIFSFNDPSEPKFNDKTFEYYHFTLDKLHAHLKNFLLLGDTIKFEGKNLRAFDANSGLNIKRLDTDFMYAADQMQFNKLYGEIGNSIIKDKLQFYYKDPSYLNDFNNKVKIIANFKETKLHTEDLAKFAPVLKSYKDEYYLNAIFVGTVKDFSMKDADIRFGKKSHFVGDLAFKNLPDVLKADMDLNLKTAFVDMEDTRQYVGDSAYNQSVKKFKTVSFDGTFKGFYNNFSAKGDFKSGLGNVLGDLQMKWDKDVTQAEYNGNITATNLELGKLLNDEKAIQSLSITTKISGKGFDLKDANVKIAGKLPTIGINGYNYKNIVVNGKLSESLFDGNLSIRDTNLIFDLKGKVDLTKDKNAFDLNGTIEKANLKALGFSNQEMILHTEMDIDLKGNTIDDIFGEAKFLNSYLTFNNKNFLIDSLYSSSVFENGSRKIDVQSEFLNASFTGKFTPSTALNDLSRLATEYEMYFFGSEAQRKEYYRNQVFQGQNRYGVDYNVKIKRIKPLFDFFIPGLYISPNAEFSGNFKVANNTQFSFFGEPDTLVYQTLKFYKNEIDLNSFKQTKIDSSGNVTPKILTSLIFNSKKQILVDAAPSEDLKVEGEWGQGNSIDFYSKIKQQNSTNKAKLHGNLTFVPDGIDIKLKSDSGKTYVNLLNKNWNIDPNNLITIANNELCISNLTLGDGNQAIALNGIVSEDPIKESSVSIQDFDLATIKPFVKDFDFEGVVNGRVSIRDIYKSTLITTDTLTIDEIIYKGKYLGSLSSNAVWNQDKKQLELNSQVVYKTNTVPIVTINGTYDPNSESNSLKLKATLRDMNLNISEPFLKDIFYDFGGTATGIVNILGSTDNPKFEGFVNFNKGKLKINTINTPLNFDNQRIVFDSKDQALKFKNFIITDDRGSEAVLNDGLYYGGGGNFLFDMRAKLTKYHIMNTDAEDISSFYGNAFATGNLELTGSPENILIKAKLTSNKDTELTVPLDGATSVAKENPFVVFIDPRIKVVEEVEKKDLKLNGMRLDFSFNFTPDAKCNILIDSKTNEKLIAQGKSTDFRVLYDTRGQFAMNGKYTITEGTYDFKFKGIATKTFTISNGSSISWSGNPYDGIIDINTTYTQNVSVASIVSTPNSNRVPVNIFISLKDKLMKFDIKYGLKFKEYPVQNKEDLLAFENTLQNDEQEMSKNVSSVLVLQQLFPKGGNPDFYSNLIIGNLSEILSKKLGDLASKLDKNLEIGVSVQNIGQNVLDNLNLRFAYKFNDKWRISGNGTSQQNLNTQSTNIFYSGEVERLLTPDGDLKLKVYTKNLPPNPTGLQNSILLNGVILQYSKSFNYIIKPKKIVQNKSELKTENLATN
jgi:hypothetical protein